jgi:hypothetical protein
MAQALHIALLVGVPTTLWFALRSLLPALIHRRVADSEAVLATIAISTFATALAKTTGFPDHFAPQRLLGDPVKPLLIIVGFVFCVIAVRAYRLKRRDFARTQPRHETADAAVRDYVERYADHFQLYGLGLALILLGI